MIVHHADRLHEGIDDGRAHEFEPLGLEILGEFLRQWRLRRYLPRVAQSFDRLPFDEAPQIIGEALLFLERQIGHCIAD